MFAAHEFGVIKLRTDRHDRGYRKEKPAFSPNVPAIPLRHGRSRNRACRTICRRGWHRRCESPDEKKPPHFCGGFFLITSLTMTYFHTGCSTIIGVISFHGPVRDGKGWYRFTMVIRHNLYRYVLPTGQHDLESGRSIVSFYLGSDCSLQQAQRVLLFSIPAKVIGTSRTGN